MDFNNDTGLLSNVAVISSNTNTVTLQSLGGVVLPAGATIDRPVTFANGVMRHNTTTGFVEASSGGSWVNISGGGAGTVTSASVVTANGLAGTVATATTAPAITLSTTVTGMLKGNGTAISAAVAGSDFVAPTVGSGVGIRQISTVVPPISGTSSRLDANTSPLITTGTQIWTQSITPRAASSTFTIDGSFYIDHDTNNRRIAVAIWRTVAGVNTLVGVSAAFITASDNGGEIAISFYDTPATTSLVTYSLRAFANGAGTWYVAQGHNPVFNGNLGKQILRLTETS